MFFTFIENFITKKYYLLLLSGLGTTLTVTAMASLIGIILGFVLVLMQIIVLPKKFIWLQKILNRISVFYIDLIRGTPVMVQLTFIWIVVFGSISVPRILVGGIAFGLNSGAYMAEIIRSGIRSIDKGQMEAGLSMGLNRLQTFRYIIIPQAFKNILPSFVNEIIALIKETSILCVIGGIDIMRAGDIMISNTGNAVYPLIIVAICYLLLTTFFSFIMRKIENKIKTSGDKIC